MKNRSIRARLLASSMVCGVALAAGGQAFAADASSSSSSDTTVGEIVVTGTMFRRTTVETPSPVTVVSADKIDRSGITTVSDAIRAVTADNSGTIPTAFGIGFAAGSSGVALRGLTVNSTLVLIDGFRTTNYGLADDGERGFVDLNTIPESVVDHVDVLKDGASALYGADAIAGVVNIVMKPSFQGEMIDAEVGTSQHGGGEMGRVAAMVGFGDLDTDKYNAYIDFEYEHDDAIHVGQRGFPYNTNDLSSIGGNNLIGGQPGNFSGSIYGSVSDVNHITGAVGPAQILAPGGCGPLGTTTTDATGTYCSQNFTLYGDDQPEQTRYGVYSRFTVKINPDTTAYLNASYFQNSVRVDNVPAQIQTSTPNNTDAITLPAVLANGSLNPNDPFAASGDAAAINYAFGDIPNYILETNHVIRAVADVKGTQFGWDYDLTGVAAHSWLNSVDAGFIDFAQLNTDIATGAYSFVDPASNSAAVRAALSPNLDKTSTTDLDSVNFQATHPVFDLPGGPLNFAIGAAWRYEATYDPDLNPDLAAQGLGIAHTIGSRTVSSAYAELDAPLFKQLDIDVAGRFDHYSDVGNNFSPKVGVKWTPIPQIVLRGTYSQGFRAPSFSENGSSASEGFITFTLPASFVAAHGGDSYTNPYVLGLLSSANPNIKPEKSENYTIGTVIEPVRFLSVSVDYYHIKKTGVIAQSSPSTALAAYFAGQPLPAGYSITQDIPDPNDPTGLARPVVVASPYINANSLVTDGIDVDFRVRFDLPGDVKLTSEVDVTDLLRFDYSQPGQGTVSYVGLESPYILSSGAGTPKWRGQWQTSLSKGPFTVTGTVNYVSSMQMVAADIVPGCFSVNNNTGANFPANCAVNSFKDFDLTGSFKLNDKIVVYANVLNLFDVSPPFDPINYAGVNYNPTFSQGGIVGRFFKVGIKATF